MQKMKKLVTVLVLSLVVIGSVNAQIKPKIEQKKPKIPTKVNPKIDITKVNSNLDLKKIKTHIKDGDYCYVLTLSSTVLFHPKGRLPVRAIDARFSQQGYVTPIEGSLKSSGKLLRGDKSYRNGEGYTVFVNQDPRDPKKVHKYGVFVTWNSSDLDRRTQQLRNVIVAYKPWGILITGNYETDGSLIGISMALTPQTCLI